MAIGIEKDILNFPITLDYLKNTTTGFNIRAGGYLVFGEKTITGTGALNINMIKVLESVQIISIWGMITEVTTLNNLTNLYFDLWDGTNSVDITADGPTAILSGAPVGSYFIKDKLATEVMGISIVNQCRVVEALREISVPFIASQKISTDTHIRLRCQTTDNPVNFKILIYANFVPINGGYLEMAA